MPTDTLMTFMNWREGGREGARKYKVMINRRDYYLLTERARAVEHVFREDKDAVHM